MTDDKARRSIISQLCAEIEVYVAFSVVDVPSEVLSDLSLAQTDLIIEIIQRNTHLVAHSFVQFIHSAHQAVAIGLEISVCKGVEAENIATSGNDDLAFAKRVLRKRLLGNCITDRLLFFLADYLNSLLFVLLESRFGDGISRCKSSVAAKICRAGAYKAGCGQHACNSSRNIALPCSGNDLLIAQTPVFLDFSGVDELQGLGRCSNGGYSGGDHPGNSDAG